jgi:hypothetical protein
MVVSVPVGVSVLSVPLIQSRHGPLDIAAVLALWPSKWSSELLAVESMDAERGELVGELAFMLNHCVCEGETSR